jgi:hypothetical protein
MTTALYTPQPGDIGLVHTNGEVGRLIRIGQWLNGDGFADFEHAFIVTDEWSNNGKQMIVQAESGGVQFVELAYSNVHWCLGLSHELTLADRAAISQAAIECIGKRYGFLDYFSLAAERLHIPGHSLFTNYVKSTSTMICSQVCAWAYFKGGKPIWPGQAWTGDDTPGDLYQQDEILRRKYALGA